MASRPTTLTNLNDEGVNNGLWAEYLVSINKVLAKINDGKYLNKRDKAIIAHSLKMTAE